jgi:hypothetical protein
MAYDFLSRLSVEDELRSKTIVYSENGKESMVTGGTVFEITRSEVRFYGGESNMEELSIPISSITEIRHNHKLVFRAKKRIDKIYPRS